MQVVFVSSGRRARTVRKADIFDKKLAGPVSKHNREKRPRAQKRAALLTPDVSPRSLPCHPQIEHPLTNESILPMVGYWLLSQGECQSRKTSNPATDCTETRS